MADHDRRNGPPRGGYNNRKRRHRDDDEYDRRPQRRRYEEPLHVKVQKQLLGIAESPLKKTEDEITNIARIVSEGYEDEKIRNTYLELTVQLVTEQPFKIPFVAATVLAVNASKPEVAQEILARSAVGIQGHLKAGAWREVKLVLRFLGCMQDMLDGDGIFPVLDELFSSAADLQTASSEDSLGLELVKIILLTIPYLMSSPATGLEKQATDILEKTDIIASAPHALEALVAPYPGFGEEGAQEPQSIIGLLQQQLQAESENGWQLSCLPRPWRVESAEDSLNSVSGSTKHALPAITIPSPVASGPRPKLPEIYFSVYVDQDIETVPPSSDLASSIVRDALIDTINILDYNRNATAKFLIDLDCYFSPNTFVKRATPFDRLKEVEDGKSIWKPEDVAVDAVFSQLFQLPMPEHKLVYYHSVLTEACKIAPAAIAPSLGRAIRVDDAPLALVYPKKAFMVGALEKEIRLSFAQRIRGTLPEPYHPLISKAKGEDPPEFKYVADQTPYAPQGREIHRLLCDKAPDPQLQERMNSIEEEASSLGLSDPLPASTDALVTSILCVGAKSLSHVLSCIERTKALLLDISARSESAQRQIITSVMEYWAEKPGTGINIVDKLLNYTILSPRSVILWALGDKLGKGEHLCQSHLYEMVSVTLYKVTNRVRQIVIARNAPALPVDQRSLLDETLEKERGEMRTLFGVVEDALLGVAEGTVDAMAESADQDENGETMLRAWGARWLRVFRRKMAVEEALIGEMLDAGPKGDDFEMQEGDVVNMSDNTNGAGLSGLGNGVPAIEEEVQDEIS
ncbi:MAG: hypothetical protein Q9191_001433 [Dirinaria sp. TL-2023a]